MDIGIFRIYCLHVLLIDMLINITRNYLQTNIKTLPRTAML